MLIISHKHYIRTNSRNSMFLLRLLCDIRETMYFKSMFFSILGLSRVLKSGFMLTVKSGLIWPEMNI